MSKKKKKHSAKKQKGHSSKSVAKNSGEQEVLSKKLISTEQKKKEAETTFSRKLEELIDKNDLLEHSFGDKILLLAAPKDYVGLRGLLRKITIGLKNLGLMFLILCFLATLFISLEIFSENRVFPREKFGEISLSFQTKEAAQKNITDQINSWLNQKQDFIYQDKPVSLSPAEMGMKVDLDQTLASLPIFDFHKNYFWDLVTASFQDNRLFPVFSIDAQGLEDQLTRQFALGGLAPHNASFYFDDKKAVQIKAENGGQKINTGKLIADLRNNLDTLSHNPIQVQLETKYPEVTAADLSAHRDNLLLQMETPIQLNSGTSSWKVKLIDHLDLVDYKKVGDQVQVDLSGLFLKNYLEPEILSKIEEAPSNIKISHDDKGKIIFDGDAVDGVSVNKPELLNQIEMDLEGLVPEVDIPTQITKAQVDTDDTLKAQGIMELIGVGHTAFAGSPPNRRYNIGVGMKKLNGIIVNQGDTFSFDDNLGPVDDTTGYKLELVIKAEGTVPEYGGGICQVSSTFFKAALWTGLPIVERANHSYAVSYYAQVDGYGLDATIYPGVHDLRFKNDTQGAILIQTEIQGDNAYVKIYGTSDGRQVKMQDYYRTNFRPAGGTEEIPTTTLPAGQRKQVESAHGGFDASWNRIITYADGTEKKENFYSVYRATSNKFLVGQ